MFLYNRGSDYVAEAQQVSGSAYAGNRAPTHVMAVIGYGRGSDGELEPWVAHQIGSGRTRSGKSRLRALRVEPLSEVIGKGQIIRVIRPSMDSPTGIIGAADTLRHTYGDAEVLLQADLPNGEAERAAQVAGLTLYPSEVSAQ